MVFFEKIDLPIAPSRSSKMPVLMQLFPVMHGHIDPIADIFPDE
jgi:hypothetical protein